MLRIAATKEGLITRSLCCTRQVRGLDGLGGAVCLSYRSLDVDFSLPIQNDDLPHPVYVTGFTLHGKCRKTANGYSAKPSVYLFSPSMPGRHDRESLTWQDSTRRTD
ncbi:hypothetical protein AFLA_013999 [Aspergillus flavus NRRL3357]|nr:hypothetical protein AFLA_013999 [Aspergillus flavus NRRL3357]